MDKATMPCLGCKHSQVCKTNGPAYDVLENVICGKNKLENYEAFSYSEYGEEGRENCDAFEEASW